MSESDTPSSPAGGPGQPQREVQPRPLSAHVPEKIARGVVATGFMASFGPNEVVLDFLQFISRPAHLAARVVMTPQVMQQFLNVLRENLSRYSTLTARRRRCPSRPMSAHAPRRRFTTN